MCIVMYGKDVAEELYDATIKTDKKLVILVGEDDKASKVYANTLSKLGASMNIPVATTIIPRGFATHNVIDYLHIFNVQDSVGSIMLMLPLYKHLHERLICDLIKTNKDIDCVGAEAQGYGYTNYGDMPCTPEACLRILEHYGIEIEGKKAVVIGRSNLVGRPVAELLLRKNATVTICHSKTKDLKAELLQADIIISAVGKPHFITPDMVKDGVVIVDVGISFKDGKICGDVDPSVESKAYAYTPVPNGVGVVSNALLLYRHSVRNGVGVWKL